MVYFRHLCGLNHSRKMLSLDLSPAISPNYFLSLLYQAKTLLYYQNFLLNHLNFNSMLQTQQDHPLEVILTYKHDTNQLQYLRVIQEMKLSWIPKTIGFNLKTRFIFQTGLCDWKQVLFHSRLFNIQLKQHP